MLLIHWPRQPTSDRRLTNRKQRKGLTQKWPLGTEVVQLSSPAQLFSQLALLQGGQWEPQAWGGNTEQTSGGETGDPAGSLLDVKGQECRFGDQRSKGRRGEKTENRKGSHCLFNPCPLRVSIYSGTNLQASREGQWGREHPFHCPLGWSSPETSPLYIGCGAAAQSWGAYTRKPA